MFPQFAAIVQSYSSALFMQKKRSSIGEDKQANGYNSQGL